MKFTLGVPADQATRTARIRAHDAFDRWRKRRGMKRSVAYAALRNTMGLTKEATHIGAFTAEQCDEVVRFVLAHSETRRTK